MAKSIELTDNTHLPSVVRVDLFSGISIDIKPVTQATLIGISKQSEKAIPFDESKYRKELPGAAVEGQTYLDTDDPTYKRDLAETQLQRDLWSKLAIYRMSIIPTPPETKDSIIERFSDDIENLRSVMDHLTEDDWDVVLQHCLFTYREDQNNIDRFLLRNAPLTFDEVADGLRIFRLKVPKQNGATVDTGRSQEFGGEQDNQ